MQTRKNLKAQREAEKLEVYNRQDKVKFLEARETIEKGKSREPIETFLTKVLSIAGSIDAGIDERDKSRTH